MEFSKFPIRNWDDSVHSVLYKFITENQGIAAFDFDNTLVKNDFGETVMNALIMQGLGFEDASLFVDHFADKEQASLEWEQRKENPGNFSNYIWNEYQNIMKKHGLEQAYRWSAFLFSGWSDEELRAISRKIWDSEIAAKGEDKIKPYPEMIDLVNFLIDSKWDVYIVTASPQSIIEEVACEFSLLPEKVIGMKLDHVNGKTNHKIIEPFTYGMGKVAAFKTKTGKKPDIAMGDSINDFPLLESSRLGFLLDRGNPDLREKCRNAGFFTQPVFL